MKAFALTWDGATCKNLMVATCPNLADAKSALGSARADGSVVAASAEDLDLSGPKLAVLYNAVVDLAFPGADNDERHVSRFKDRPSGQRRIFELLDEHFKNAPEAAAPSIGDATAATETNEEDMATKGKKVKKAAKPKKAPRIKKERVAGPKKTRSYKTEVVSKGSEKSKADALALVERKNGATADEIKDKLGVSLGTAKNLIWYLRRDGKKIVVDKTSERRPYIIA